MEIKDLASELVGILGGGSKARRDIEVILDCESYERFKLDEIKIILRHFKSKGHKGIYLSEPKKRLIERLKPIISDILKSDKSASLGVNSSTTPTPHHGSSASGQSACEAPVGKSEVAVRINAVSSSLRNTIDQMHESPDLGRQVVSNNAPMSCSSSILAVASIPDVNATPTSSDGDSSSSSFMDAPSTDPSDTNVLQDLAITVYQELRQSGFSHEQCLFGIESCRNNCHDVNFDDACVYIVSYEEDDEYKADIDRAILASEGERECIQERKRSRLQELQTCCAVKLGSAEEFSKSLLFATTPTQGVAPLSTAAALVFSSSSSSCNVPTLHKRLRTELNDGKSTAPALEYCSASETVVKVGEGALPSIRSTAGSELVRLCVRALDTFQCQPMERHITSACTCGTHWMQLRQTLAKVLELEANSLKWWKERCHAFIYQLAGRLDSLITCDTSDIRLTKSDFAGDEHGPTLKQKSVFSVRGQSSINFDMKSSSANTSEMDDKLQVQLGEVGYNEALRALGQAVEDLSSALFAMPAHAGAVPQAFIDADPCSHELDVDGYDVDKDGFEIIVPMKSTSSSSSTSTTTLSSSYQTHNAAVYDSDEEDDD